MPLDPSIALQAGQGVKPVDPMAAFQQVMMLRAMADQSKAQQLGIQQQERAMQRQEGIGRAYAVGPDGQIDQAATLRNLAAGGFGPEAAQASHQFATDQFTRQKAEREANKAGLEAAGKQMELINGELGSLVARGDALTYADAMRGAMRLRANGVSVNLDEIPQDPAQLRAYVLEKAIQNDKVFKNYQEMNAPKSPQGQVLYDAARAPASQQGAFADIIAGYSGKADDIARFQNGVPTVNNAVVDARKQIAKAGAQNTTIQNYPPGALVPGKTTQGKIEEELRGTGARLSRLTQINSMFKPEFLNIQKRLSGSWSAIKEKLGGNLDPKDKQFLSEFSQFKQSAIEQLNQYINEITGAAVGATEAPRLISAMPNPGSGAFDGDSPTEFKTKLDSVMKQVKMAEARQVYALRNGLSLFDGKGNPLITLERMPQIMNERGKAIEKEVRAKYPQLGPKDVQARVARQLGGEFGLATD